MKGKAHRFDCANAARYGIRSLIVVALTLCGAGSANAQSGGAYVIKKSTIGSGGGTVTGGSYRLSGTVGQHDAGPLAGSPYALNGGFWSPAATAAAPDALLSEPSPMSKNRYVSFAVPTSGTGSDTAVRVRLTSLHHPAGPPSAPNFSAFEGQYRYLNALRDGSNNPVFVCPDSAASATTYKCAKLGCSPEYRDWAGIFGGAVVHVTGDSVVPSSQYAVSQLASSCAGNEASCAAVSADLTVSTERWGNVDDSPAGGTPNAVDLGFIVSKVKDVPGAFIEPRCQLQGATPNPFGLAVSALDIARGVDAVKGLPYPFTISSCP